MPVGAKSEHRRQAGKTGAVIKKAESAVTDRK